MLRPHRARLLLSAAAVILLAAGCTRPVRPGLGIQGQDAAGLREADRRLLFAQVVDDRNALDECGILEGRVYKYLLRLCAATSEPQLRQERDHSATFSRLDRQPDLFRGHVVTRQGVIVEVGRAELPPEYALPGYAVLLAIMLCEVPERGPEEYDVYEVRILSPAGSDLYQVLERGIKEHRNPALWVSGYFMKCHAKLTNRPDEPPWRRPMLVAPEPSVVKAITGTITRDAQGAIHDAGLDNLLPTRPLPGPRTEERLVVELVGDGAGPRGAALRVDGRLVALDDAQGLSQAVQGLLGRLPEEQRGSPSGVVLITPSGPRARVGDAVRALRQAGLKRVFVKDENETLLPETPPGAQPAASEAARRGPWFRQGFRCQVSGVRSQVRGPGPRS